ncbi:MAG: sigma 54-interacting transcriptional regulator [Polyangiales bacterium]
MNPRVAFFVGVVGTLYVATDVASRGGLPGAVGIVGAALAVATAVLPWFLRRDRAVGVTTLRVLAAAAGLGAMGTMDAEGFSALAGASGAVGLLLASWLTLDLSLAASVGWGRGRWLAALRLGVALIAVGSVVLFFVGGVRALAVGHGVFRSHVPAAFAVVVVVAWFIQIGRMVGARSAEEHATHLWAVLGLGVAVPLVGLGASWWPPTLAFRAPLFAAGVFFVVFAQLAVAQASWRISASRLARRAVVGAVALGAAVTTGLFASPWFSPGPARTVAVAAIAVVVARAVVLRVGPVIDAVLSPFGGRLLEAIDAIRRSVRATGSLDALARETLRPLRVATGALDAEPLLFTCVPAEELRIDAAGEPHVRAVGLPPAVLAYLADHPAGIVIREDLERNVVRRPDLRPVVDALRARDVLAVVPLVVAGEVEGALYLPRGARRVALRLEELRALESLGAELASIVGVLTEVRRAELRMRSGEARRLDVEEALEDAEDRLALGRAAVRASLDTAKPAGHVVAYAPSTRAMLEVLRAHAVGDGPVLFVAEDGSGEESFARLLHELGPRAHGPFVAVGAGDLRATEAEQRLFGTRGEGAVTGFLELAHGGTLFVRDVVALPLDVQARLVSVIAERRAATVGGTPAAYDADVRLVATARLAPSTLLRNAAIDVELERRLSQAALFVPPLRERKEDIPSLVLLALDRESRALGREPMGIEPDALAKLVAHAWPGNLVELHTVLVGAVARATGVRVTVTDLPNLEAPDAAVDPLAGTYDELELRILLHALDRAGGNKSEAARLLGLKRTTFLDKLRRFGSPEEATRAGS